MLTLILVACTSSTLPTDTDTPTSTPTETEILPEDSSVQGSAAKGPFLEAALLRVFKLADDGSLTTVRQFGRTDIRGAFLVPPLLFEGYAEVEVEGKAYNELTGENGETTWTLQAVAAIEEGKIRGHVNLLTDLHHQRVLTLLQTTPGDFDAARTTALADLATLFPIAHPPEQLQLIDETDPGLERDNGILLAYSAAVLAANVTPDELETLAADFGDNGHVDTDGVPILDRIRGAASDTDYIVARDNLLDRYGSAPPALPFRELSAWVHFGCGTVDLASLCEGTNEPAAPLLPDSWTTYTFVPPHDGAWLVGANLGTFNNFHRWSLTDANGNVRGAANMQSNNLGTTDALEAGSAYTLSVFNAGDIDTTVSIDLQPASVGTAARPDSLMLDIDEEGFTTVANAGAGPASFYRVERSQLAVDATLDVVVSDISGDVEIQAYTASHTDAPENVFDDPSRRLTTVIGPSARLDDLQFDEVLLLAVTSRDTGFDPTSTTPTRLTYRIQIH